MATAPRKKPSKVAKAPARRTAAPAVDPKAAARRSRTPKAAALPPAVNTAPAAVAERTLVGGLKLLQVSRDGTCSDPAFQPYDLKAAQRGNDTLLSSLPGALPMLNALRLAHRDTAVQQASLWGLLPRDFTQRTLLTGVELEAAIADNPGFDLYYCSANPELEAVYHNPWRSPAVTHPEFVETSRAFLTAAGLSDSPVDAISHSSLFATGNLMVATPALWSQYLAFVEKVMGTAYGALDRTIADRLYKEAPIAGRMTYLALITARLLGVFLMMRDSKFRALKVPLVKQERALNPHLRVLREMKDIGLEQRSRWHLTSWGTYRGLYLAHVMGKAWVMEHIKATTPTAALTAIPVPTISSPYPRAFPVAQV